MPILQNIKSCVRRKQGITRRPTKIYFNVRMVDSFKSENLASQLRDLLVYIAREGVIVTDLFRRPGNIQSIKKIIADLESGRPINWTSYNFYTLANIAKRFLLHIDGGMLGEGAEKALLEALDIPDIDIRNAKMKSIITSQPKIVQQLLTLLFGTWFRMIYHTEVNAMSVEAVAKSVAGSIFPSCTYSPEKVEKASKVVEVLIVGFASTELFGRDLIEYFTQETNTSISRVEKFKYEFRYPKYAPKPHSAHIFCQMLIEESKKHGFDILKDEVTKEEFELANQLATDTPARIRMAKKADSSSVVHPVPGLRAPLVPLPSTMQSYGGQLDSTQFNIHRLNKIDPDGSNGLELCLDRVQQYSEKRTRITCADSAAPNDLCFRHRGVETDTTPSKNVSGLLGRQYDSLTEIDYVSKLQEQSQHPLPGTAVYGSCFNSVKKRQLERLQKRSEWFLSPPAGLRNSGMMRIDVSALPGSPQNHPKVLKCGEGEHLGRKSAAPESGDTLRRKTSIRALHQPTDGGEWSANPVCTDSNVLSSSRQFTFTSRGEDKNSIGTAGSDLSAILEGLSGSADELFETRYFIAVKSYGPGLESPSQSRPNAAHLQQVFPSTNPYEDGVFDGAQRTLIKT